MFGALFDFVFGFFIGRGIANSGRAARNTAALVEMAALSEPQKVAYAKRAEFLRGERRFVFGVFLAMLAVIWIAGALFGVN